jgi:hypothetical protein
MSDKSFLLPDIFLPTFGVNNISNLPFQASGCWQKAAGFQSDRCLKLAARSQ